MDGQLVYGLKRRRLIVTLAAHAVRLDCLGPNNEELSGHRDRVVLDNVYLLALYNTRTKMIRNGVANLSYKYNNITALCLINDLLTFSAYLQWVLAAN